MRQATWPDEADELLAGLSELLESEELLSDLVVELSLLLLSLLLLSLELLVEDEAEDLDVVRLSVL